ncbi:hypothetical protein P7C70_g1675, partial [Phenoliferia sp. Uapishka_3]
MEDDNSLAYSLALIRAAVSAARERQSASGGDVGQIANVLREELEKLHEPAELETGGVVGSAPKVEAEQFPEQLEGVDNGIGPLAPASPAEPQDTPGETEILRRVTRGRSSTLEVKPEVVVAPESLPLKRQRSASPQLARKNQQARQQAPPPPDTPPIPEVIEAPVALRPKNATFSDPASWGIPTLTDFSADPSLEAIVQEPFRRQWRWGKKTVAEDPTATVKGEVTMGGNSKSFVPSPRAVIYLKQGHLQPDTHGAPFIFFDGNTKNTEVEEAINAMESKSISVLGYVGLNKWQCYGRYKVAFKGRSKPGELRSLIKADGTTWVSQKWTDLWNVRIKGGKSGLLWDSLKTDHFPVDKSTTPGDLAVNIVAHPDFSIEFMVMEAVGHEPKELLHKWDDQRTYNNGFLK